MSIVKTAFSKAKNMVLVAALPFLLTSCLKEDEPVKPHEPGEAISNSFNMGPNYRYQSFFNLETNSFVSQNLKDIWDIGFDCRNGEYAIVLNGAKLCKVWRTGQTDFAAVTDTVGSFWRADDNSGRLDSTAIGEWGTENGDTVLSAGQVYVINRGYDSNLNLVGLVKMKIEGANATSYRITYANLDGSNPKTITVNKDDAYNLTFVSFTTGESVIVEPPKNQWDITFSQYVYVYRTTDYPYFPYLVTGVLHNRNLVISAADSARTFDDIVLADTAMYTFATNVDVIGYDWKYVDIGPPAVFTIRPEKNYIIRTRNKRYYKLHFTDFYKDGIKGNIVFEFQQL